MTRLAPASAWLAAAALAAGCATAGDATRTSGSAGPVAWEIQSLRHEASDTRVRWFYTVTLKETAGSAVQFEKLDTLYSFGAPGGSRREELFARRLAAKGQIGSDRSVWRTRSGLDRWPSVSVFHRFSGRDASGKPLTVDVQFTLTSEAGRDDRASALTLQARELLDGGNYAEGVRKAREALARWERALGPDHLEVASALNLLGLLLVGAGDYAAARPLYERALKIRTETLGPDDAAVADALNNLALLLYRARDYASARVLYERALRISEAALGPDDPAVAVRLDNLAAVLRNTGDYAAARPLYERALRIKEASFDPDHPVVARTRNNFATLLRLMGDYATAEPLYRRALDARQRALGAQHPDVAVTAHNLALVVDALGRHAEAEPLYRRAVAIREAALGADHPRVAEALVDLAAMLARAGKTDAARGLYERARRIYLVVARANLQFDDDAHRSLLGTADSGLRRYLDLLADIAARPRSEAGAEPAWADAFVVADQARAGPVHAALARASAWAAARDPALSALVRQVQDLRPRRQAVRKELTEEYGRAGGRDAARVRTLQDSLARLERELAELGTRVSRDFPDYAELIVPDPIDLQAARGLVGPDEALVSFFTLDERVLVWLVRRGREPVYRELPVTGPALSARVARVRASADQSANGLLSEGRLMPFDVVGAHELYTGLLGPLAADLAGVTHLLIVPDERLLPLPFPALITRADSDEFRMLAAAYAQARPLTDAELAAYARLAWLGGEHAITVLPSATALRALRQLAPRRGAPAEPFIGFGDPLFMGEGSQRGGVMVAARGASAPVDALRRLSRLPGTRDELLAIATALGADARTAVYLRDAATKAQVLALNRSGRLGGARVLSFATHALTAGDLEGLAEPALVFTPPRQPSDEDDGLLSLQDVLGLKLPHADWVVLSACRTAADDGSGAALSGLARAFFFAGARSLLVSHWSVDDRATQALMTQLFRRYAGGEVARAEALRQAMVALRAEARGARAYFGHPFAWAPFFLVGEGGRDLR